jgi:hypothetical protein
MSQSAHPWAGMLLPGIYELPVVPLGMNTK